MAMRLWTMAIALILLTSAGWAAEPAEAPPAGSHTSEEAAPRPELTPEEQADAKIGKSAAVEIEKQYTVVADHADLPRIQGIVERIRPVTQKPHLEYQVKVIDTKAVNAFSLPGGYLYFTQGLLNAVESDDELAAVTAHEMAHNCLAHSRRLMSKDERYQQILGSLLLVTILTDAQGVNPGAIATVGGLVAQDALNHYGREAEFEADQQAVLYLKRSGHYHPVAVLTVVEGLTRLERSGGERELGVFQTHPYGEQRVRAVADSLVELGIPIERRRVTNSLVVDAARATKDGREIGEIRLNARVIFQPVAEAGGVSPAARAERSARTVRELLYGNLQLLEIMTIYEGDSALFLARGEVLFTITPADAEIHATDVPTLARQALAAIQLGFREERVLRAY